MKTLASVIGQLKLPPHQMRFSRVALAFYPLKFNLAFTGTTRYLSGLNTLVHLDFGGIEIPTPISKADLQFNSEGVPFVRVSAPDEMTRLDHQGYAIVLAAFGDTDPEPWRRIRSSIGLIALLEQDRVFQRPLLRLLICQKTGALSQLSPESPFPVQPVLFRTPEATLTAIAPLLDGDFESGYIGYAMDWFYKSISTEDEIFAFLSAWIACETLAKCGDKQIHKLVQILHASLSKSPNYNCSNTTEAKDYLLLGRLHGMRSNLAHNGIVKGINKEVATYIQLVFAESLFAVRGVPSPGLVTSFLSARRDAVLSSIASKQSR